MYKKIVDFQLTSGILLSFFIFFPLKAKEDVNNYQNAFYAISSLTFYLQKTISNVSIKEETHGDKINFSEADIASLWHTASSYAAMEGEIEKAQGYYYEAVKQREDQAAFIELCQEAHTIVRAVWYAVNPYTAKEQPTASKRLRYPHFDDNPYINDAMQNKMRPYLLPLNNKLKASLDKIFNRSRAIQNKASFAKAGFITLFHQPYSHIRVAKHTALPGYLLKVYFDTDALKDKAGWDRFTERCQGARSVRRLIKEKNLKHFSVPDKWLYPLPFSNIPSTIKPNLQTVVLVVTDMNLVSLRESRKAWRSKVTHKHLDELYCILSHGFGSRVLPHNIPYGKNGTFACIDTEAPEHFDYDRVRKYLSPKMLAYWDELVRKGGKS
jgi:hypothetical protein